MVRTVPTGDRDGRTHLKPVHGKFGAVRASGEYATGGSRLLLWRKPRRTHDTRTKPQMCTHAPTHSVTIARKKTTHMPVGTHILAHTHYCRNAIHSPRCQPAKAHTQVIE